MSDVQVSTDRVVLLDEHGAAMGTAAKEGIHSAHTPLHLAFSCYVSNSAGDLLVTRRALGKRSWPGVWTNAFCGHPAPGEAVEDAVVRHAKSELGLHLDPAADRLVLELADFRYRAVDASGIVENEVCPVYTVVTDALPVPNPDEVVETAWVDPLALAAAIDATPWAFSPWLVLQAQQLAMLRMPATASEADGVDSGTAAAETGDAGPADVEVAS